MAHPTRFERVAFAFGGQRFYAANRGMTFSTNRKNRVVRAPGFEPTRLHLGAMDRARTAAFSRLFKLPPTGLGCPPIRKQGSCDSGYRDVADPRYQPPEPRQFYMSPPRTPRKCFFGCSRIFGVSGSFRDLRSVLAEDWRGPER